jgi:chalcone isomerase
MEGEQMIKHVFFGFLRKVHPTDALRYYLRFHSKEVVRSVGPWLRRYETYQSFPPPPEAKKFRALGGFMTELWYPANADYLEAKADERPYTPPPGGWSAALGPITFVPAMPTEDFLGKEPAPEEKHIIRWCRLLKYPEGVSVKDGEEWYLKTHSQETKQQPGLLRYVSHRVIENLPAARPWHRLEELWYEDFDIWQKANLEIPPEYTAPGWQEEEPFVDMASIFVGYKPDFDFLKEDSLIP